MSDQPGFKNFQGGGHWIVDPLDPYRYVRLEDGTEISIKKKDEKKKGFDRELVTTVLSILVLLALAMV